MKLHDSLSTKNKKKKKKKLEGTSLDDLAVLHSLLGRVFIANSSIYSKAYLGLLPCT